MKITVLIPTYRRTASLESCLQGLAQQSRAPDEVLIVAPEDDEESSHLVEQWRHWPAVKLIQTAGGGQVKQLNAGLENSIGDVVAITDDDAVPQTQWLSRIEHRFAENPDVGGVGGRDLVWEKDAVLSGSARSVGKILWFGRIAGNHHLGTRLVPCVDFLKGANMSFRMTAIRNVRFDTDLRGSGAQTCNDMAFSLAVQSRGWRLLFDPEIAVDHYPAQRFDTDQRGTPSLKAVEDRSFNFYLTLKRHVRKGVRRHVAISWARSVGAANTPGLLRGIVSRLLRHHDGLQNRAAAQRAWVAVQQQMQTAGQDRPAPIKKLS